MYVFDKHAVEMMDALQGRVERLDGAEEATAGAICDLKQSCTALDDRLNLAAAGNDGGVEQAAENLSARVEAVREDLSRQLAASADARFDRVEQALAEMSDHVRTAEQRSASAVERMGREVLEVAQSLSRRVHTVERTSAEAADRVTAEVSRMTGAVEDRLARADTIQAQALEKLGAEIARITERLADRIANAERRSAQAMDDVGEQVARVTERVSQRHERSTSELVERIRLSEERTARLLDEARQKIDDRMAETQRRVTEAARPAQPRYDEADEALFGEAPFPGYETPPAERASAHAPEPAPFVVAPTYSQPAPTVFDDEDFESVASYEPSPAPAAHEPMLEDEAQLAHEPQPAYRAASASLDLDEVELEPNVGFDVDDELIGPATHLFSQPPVMASSLPPQADSFSSASAARPPARRRRRRFLRGGACSRLYERRRRPPRRITTMSRSTRRFRRDRGAHHPRSDRNAPAVINERDCRGQARSAARSKPTSRVLQKPQTLGCSRRRLWGGTSGYAGGCQPARRGRPHRVRLHGSSRGKGDGKGCPSGVSDALSAAGQTRRSDRPGAAVQAAGGRWRSPWCRWPPRPRRAGSVTVQYSAAVAKVSAGDTGAAPRRASASWPTAGTRRP